MISDQVYNVLTNGIGHIGCTSSSLRPFHADPLGICCDQATNTIVCCLNRKTNKLFLEQLEIGSRVSLFAAVISHEAYNLKGAVTELRDVNDYESQVCDALREKMYGFYGELGIPKNLALVLGAGMMTILCRRPLDETVQYSPQLDALQAMLLSIFQEMRGLASTDDHRCHHRLCL